MPVSTKTSKRKSNSAKAPQNKAIGTLCDLTESDIEAMLDKLSQADKKLKNVISKTETGFTLRIEETDSPFEAIAEAIVYQQLTGKAAATIFGRFKALFGKGDKCPSPAQIVKAPDTVLRGAGLSGSKIKALKDLAEKSISGLIPSIDEIERMSDEDVVATLVAVRGVGTWTAHMFLIFRLGRLDVMPSGDYGVRKGFAITYGDPDDLPSPAELEEHAECWRPFRSVGSWYMWRAVEQYRASRPQTKEGLVKTARKKVAKPAEKPKSKLSKSSNEKKPVSDKRTVGSAARSNSLASRSDKPLGKGSGKKGGTKKGD